MYEFSSLLVVRCVLLDVCCVLCVARCFLVFDGCCLLFVWFVVLLFCDWLFVVVCVLVVVC